MKTCTTCKETHEHAHFSKDKSRWDGYQASCKTCKLQSSRKWQEANPDRTAAIAGKGRVIKIIGEHGISDIYDLDLCVPFYAEARRLDHEVDHIIPLSKGGLHCQTNLQVIPVFDNRSKGNT